MSEQEEPEHVSDIVKAVLICIAYLHGRHSAEDLAEQLLAAGYCYAVQHGYAPDAAAWVVLRGVVEDVTICLDCIDQRQALYTHLLVHVCQPHMPETACPREPLVLADERRVSLYEDGIAMQLPRPQWRSTSRPEVLRS